MYEDVLTFGENKPILYIEIMGVIIWMEKINGLPMWFGLL